MKYRVPEKRKTKEDLDERLSKRTVKYVNWTKRMVRIVVNEKLIKDIQ